MTREELLKMLDLDRPAKEEKDADDPFAPPGDGKPTAGTAGSGPTVLDLDQWGLRRGADFLAAHPEVAESAEAMADLFGAAFEPEPQLASGGCRDGVRERFMKQLMETPEYHALHEDTQLDEVASEIAAAHFASRLAEARRDCEKVEREGKTAGKGGKASGAAGEARKDAAICKAVCQATAAASHDVEELHEASRALGIGSGGSQRKLDPKAVAATYRRIRNSQRLRRICELAGRFRRLAQGKQRLKATHGYDDMVGVEPDGDVARLLPHEAAQLADEDLELDALRRLVERQSLCRQYQATEPVGKGPIVVVVDESGSMDGDPINSAKALALAMAWIARQQRRWCALVAFADGHLGRQVILSPHAWDELALMDWLEQFICGGTDPDVPLRTVPFVYWPEFVRQGMRRGKTDMVIITDAAIRIPPEMAAAFNAWKAAEKVKVTTLIIEQQPGDMAAVSDACHVVRAITADEAGVEAAVSL